MDIHEFLSDLPEDPLDATKELCDSFLNITKHQDLEYLETVALYSAIVRYIQNSNIHIEGLEIKFTGTRDDSITITNTVVYIIKQIYILKANIAAENATHIVDTSFDKIKRYKLNNSDIELIQKTIDELRTIIVKSDELTVKQKAHLLKKLEKMQSTLHKVVFDFDPFWGFWAEAGFTLRQFDNNAAPFLDRVERIMRIVFKAQAEQEELPSGFELPKLSSSKEDKE